MRQLRKKKSGTVKVNVIPILDAVFIFIFFLLMSAQFLDVYELGTDAPAVSVVKEEDKKDPLNLTLKITKKRMVVMTGLESKVIKTISLADIQAATTALKETLVLIKRENIDENSIIFRPSEDVPYNKLVKIMDTVKQLDPKELPVASNDKKQNQLFDQIIFETM